MAKKARIDTVRTLAYTSISGSYAAVGTGFNVEARIICITNNTDADMIFSLDPAVTDGQLYLPKGTFKLFDVTTNMNPNIDDTVVFEIGTTVYVKQASSPGSGNVIVEILYAV